MDASWLLVDGTRTKPMKICLSYVVNRTRALFSFFALHLVCTVSVNNSGRHRFYIPTGCINQVRRKPRCVVFAPTRNFSNFSNPLDSLWTAENG